MRRCSALIALTLALTGLASAGGFSLRLAGGAALAAGGDYSRSIEGLNDYYSAAFDNVTGTFSQLPAGLDLAAEFVFEVTDRIAIGVGGGFSRFSRSAETVGYDWPILGLVFRGEETISTAVSTIPLTLNIHYALPLGGWKVDLFAGLGYYLSRVEIRRSSAADFFGLGSDVEFEAHPGAVGLQGGVGLDMPLGRGLALVVNLCGRYARLSNIRGDYRETPTVFGVSQPSRTGSDYYFWTYTRAFGGADYQVFSLETTGPSGPAYSGVRHGRFDLTGVGARAGIRIGF
jgi:hypothetical protein